MKRTVTLSNGLTIRAVNAETIREMAAEYDAKRAQQEKYGALFIKEEHSWRDTWGTGDSQRSTTFLICRPFVDDSAGRGFKYSPEVLAGGTEIARTNDQQTANDIIKALTKTFI